MVEQYGSKEQFREFVQRMEDRFDYGLVVFGFIGGIVLILFRDFIFK